MKNKLSFIEITLIPHPPISYHLQLDFLEKKSILKMRFKLLIKLVHEYTGCTAFNPEPLYQR